MLKPLLIFTIRGLSRLASFNERRKLLDSLGDPELAQLKLLGQLQLKLKRTERIKHFQWSSQSDYSDFVMKIPCVNYDDLEPFIQKQMRDSTHELSADEVAFYERTSGSSGVAKFVPYTKSYLKILNRLFLLWVDDLINSHLRFRTAKTFLCVTPALHQEEQGSSVQIGSNTDVDYVAPWLGFVTEQFLVAPLNLSRVRDANVYRDLLCLYLLSADDLEIISLWSPSFWFAMLAHWSDNRERLHPHLQSGRYEAGERQWTFKPLNDARLKLLLQKTPDWDQVWPDISLISCWDQAHAAKGAHRLSKMFPKAFLQGKGLLATEAPVTLPLMQANVSVPFLTSVFIEGEDLEDQQIYPIWKWKLDHSYRIIISVPNGFLRYRLGDVVKVSAFYLKTPIFEFMGRDAQLMDMVGEKLLEDFAYSALNTFGPLAGQTAFFPVQNAHSSFYVLMMETDQPGLSAAALEEALMQSHHYRLARNLGQLQPLQIAYSRTWTQRYLNLAEKRGQQLGNIKLASFHKRVYSEDEMHFLRGFDS